MKIYTKTGDQGETGLYRGGRIRKDSLRISACGEVDELNSFIGFARTYKYDPQTDGWLQLIQNHIFVIGADLATPYEAVKSGDQVIRLEENAHLFMEAAIDEMDAQMPPLREFILPGGMDSASRLHMARSVCRRAERAVIALSAQETISPSIIVFLNRLSDFLFVLARWYNNRGHADVKWQKISGM